MTSRLAVLALATLVALPAAAQPHTPPASLSQDEMHGLMMGQGMGLARAAEMQGFPGPKHVLELADSLALSDDQRRTAEALMARVQAEARALGARIVGVEAHLSEMFEADEVDRHHVEGAAHESARLHARLRLVHLAAHLDMRQALTAEQAARYHALRHGPDASSGGGPGGRHGDGH
ncbi:Spy/CpxP family protein refolding chaperone [Rubricoccus marinus]|uniref:Periplasmic heavy metal sensor n=1 Tax=Rubricoccus marinus TaxID=716817 RepID=A0A259TUH8_9BACT|nr:Spy/CpxP family protein refolding chaperone [Rubricoccus marinus]OZC01409.1 hypothetical protein BSZ36_17130 [Rubricoccus marinus]